MPVVAVVGGERVEAWTFDPARWEELRRSYKSLGLVMSCGQPGIPSRSPRGLFFFRHHARPDCGGLHDGGDETAEHFTAKALVAETARALGWTATVERRSDDGTWIADVLVEHPLLPRPIAVEIQWSRQSNEDFHRRQDRYTAAGVDCFWVIGPVNRNNANGVPAHQMTGSAESLSITVPITIDGNVRETTFTEAITLILNRLTSTGEERLVEDADLISTALIIETTRINCQNEDCGRPMTRWRLAGVSTESRCGQRQYLDLAPGHSARPRPQPAVAAIVTAAIAASGFASPALYEIKAAHRTGATYLAFACPHCKKPQWDLNISDSEWVRNRVPHSARVPFRPEVTRRPHRCVNVGRGHCLPAEGDGTFPTELGFKFTAGKELAAPLPEKAPATGPEKEWKTPRQRKRAAAEQRAARERRATAQALIRTEQERARAVLDEIRARELQVSAIARRAELEQAWPDSELRADVLAAHGGAWPNYLNYTPRSVLALPNQMWEAELWNLFVRDRQHLTSIDPRLLSEHLRLSYPGIKDPANAIREWLLELTSAGQVSEEQRGDAPSRYFWTLNPEEVRLEAEKRAGMEARIAAAREAAFTTNHVSKPTTQTAATPKCRLCGFPLDPIYFDVGYHDVCADGYKPRH